MAIAATVLASGAIDASLDAAGTEPAVRVVRDTRFNSGVWPADFNRDGITDLASSAAIECGGGTCRGGQVQVALGRGDGTFSAPVLSSFVGVVLGVGDFNGDSRVDVIAAGATTADGVPVAILPGTGTATLGTAVSVTTLPFDDFLFAASADLNGDNKRDLVLPGPLIFPGNGDFTFGPRISIANGTIPAEAIIADLDGDGLRDIVTASYYDASITIFNNRGGFNFGSMNIPVSSFATDVTVANVNGDQWPDLLVSAGRVEDTSGFGDGYVFVLLGTGKWTFAPAVRYDVIRGPTQIVAVDWNRDGAIDIVTGNRSSIVRDDCTDVWKTWDSVSVLLGRGDGTFSAPSHFSLGDQRLVDVADPQYGRFKNTLRSLNTSDLNRDGRTDLIASNGALVFSVAATTNGSPTVDFGPDVTLMHTHETVLQPKGADPDEDVLTWEIRDDSGRVIATYPNVCWTDLHDGRNTFTVTVNDGHGHSASDTLVITVQTGDGTGAFSAGQDIGAVGAAGSEAYDGDSGRYTVLGSGADIWGTADEFRFVSTALTGDFTIQARVESIQNVQAWTKAGLMIRENLTAGSRHAAIFATPGKGLAFQRRASAGGTSVNTSGPLQTAPVWIQLSRRGNVVTAYWRKDLDQFWTPVGQQTFTTLAATVYAGLAVTSHQDGTLARAAFTNVIINQTTWTRQAIGSGSGTANEDGVVFTVSGRGADIWGTADAFYYVYTRATGNFSLTARVRSLTDTQPWTKAGVMIRESVAANARHAFALVSAGKGVALQYRSTTGGASAQAANIGSAAPGWLQIVRHTDRIDAAWSTDGFTWNYIGGVSITMADEVLVGLPVTSHDTAATATAVFDDVLISPF